MNFNAVIFDLDGTLLDSMYIWDTLAEDYLKSIGVEAKPGLCDAVNTLMMEDAAVYLKEEYSLPYPTEKILADIFAIVDDFYFNTSVLKDGVLDFLTQLNNLGIKMCIATASERYVVEAALKRCLVFDFFDRIFTCSEVGYSKTDPKIFFEAAEFLGEQPKDILVFEDALFAAQTAKNAGFKVCGIYDPSEKCITELKRTVDFYINSFKEAGDLID